MVTSSELAFIALVGGADCAFPSDGSAKQEDDRYASEADRGDVLEVIDISAKAGLLGENSVDDSVRLQGRASGAPGERRGTAQHMLEGGVGRVDVARQLDPVSLFVASDDRVHDGDSDGASNIAE
jgi:hypothetical protein